MGTVRERGAMIAGMAPVLDPETYHFCIVTDRAIAARAAVHALASFSEAEGLSLILSEIAARQFGLVGNTPMRRITLSVYSDLEGVGLTAAVAGVLADNEIACNMVAAFHHDHAFVPAADAVRAVALLEALAREAEGGAA